MSNQKLRTVKERIQDAVDKGLDAFWEQIFKEFNELNEDPPISRSLEYDSKEEVKKWLTIAAPEYEFDMD
jgi:hypothetical protein